MKTMKEVLIHYNFHWDSKQELWVRKESFGRKSTIDIMFKNLFIINKSGVNVYSHFIESFEEFLSIIRKNFK